MSSQDGAHQQVRPLSVDLLQDRVDAKAEEEGAHRVPLLLAGAGLQLAQLAVRAPHQQVRAVRVELRCKRQQLKKVQVHLLQERDAELGIKGVATIF
jgi:hypothetical protein